MADRPVALEALDIHKRFGDHEVLKGVSLTAHQGDVIAMLGASGSGKSTFLRCINLLETPNQGRIVLRGEELRLKPGRDGLLHPEDSKQLQRIRSKLAMVFQQFNLWAHMTVLENVIEAPVHVLKVPRKEAIEKAEMLLDKVGLLARKDYYPIHLSGGQQQRVAIARGLAMEPEVLLFDEPTSALDPIATAAIEELIGELKGKVTSIIVTHNLQQAARVSQNTVFMYLGEIIEAGPTEQIFTAPKQTRTQDYITGRFG